VSRGPQQAGHRWPFDAEGMTSLPGIIPTTVASGL
jgi:hypothetical protein